jgi:hypothetical protein
MRRVTRRISERFGAGRRIGPDRKRNKFASMRKFMDEDIMNDEKLDELWIDLGGEG